MPRLSKKTMFAIEAVLDVAFHVGELDADRLMADERTPEGLAVLRPFGGFGERDAGMARFHGRANGEPGTRLRELYDCYVKARDAYEAQ